MSIPERPIADDDVGIDRRLGIALVSFFLVAISLPAVVQLVWEVAGDRPLQELDMFTRMPDLQAIKRYEDELAKVSCVAELARPFTQLAQLTALNQGNENVMVGREGWLFFRPGAHYVTGFPFRSRYVGNDAKARNWDPLPAILDFHRQLHEQGIELAVVPLPVKPQIYPEKLTRAYDTERGPPANSYAEEFFYELRDAGIAVFDLSEALWEAKEHGEMFLRLDTHWTPLGMKTAARALAEQLRLRYGLLFSNLPPPDVGVTIRTRRITRHGDNYYQLDLPEWSRAFAPQQVMIEQVIDKRTGTAVARDNEDALICLLGDSFTNIYSRKEPNERGMRWGKGAGFGEHLMKELGRKIQVIAVNGGAPSATRKRLARTGGLERRKLVIWSFATRELIAPDTSWDFVAMPPGGKRDIRIGPVTVTARVRATSRAPRPRVDPYPDAITLTSYDVEEVETGEYGAERLVAAEWVMRDFKLLGSADYRTGDTHRLTLIPYASKEKQSGLISEVKQLDDTNDYSPLFWVDSCEVLGK